MQQVKNLVETVQQKIELQVETEIKHAKQTVENLQSRMQAEKDFASLNSDQQEKINAKFRIFYDAIQGHRLIAVTRDALRRFEDIEYPRILSLLSDDEFLNGKKTKNAADEKDFKKEKQKTETSKTEEPKYEYVSCRSIKIPFKKAWLSDENDVESYVNEMKKALLKEINNGKRIQI